MTNLYLAIKLTQNMHVRSYKDFGRDIVKILSLIACFLPLSIKAQNTDNILWAKISASQDLNPETTIAFAPIVRYRDDISEYQDFSLDYSIKRKLNKNFSVQLTGRTWFLRSGRKRQFIWPQISYTSTKDKLKINSYLRWHAALDLDDFVDVDFLRWKTSLSHQTTARLNFSIGAEPWYRLDEGDTGIRRNRYYLGAGYKLSSDKRLTFDWWRQLSSFNGDITENIFVVHLAFKI